MQLFLHAQPDPLADAILGRHPGKRVARWQYQTVALDDLLGNARSLNLKQDVSRPRESVGKMNFDVERHEASTNSSRFRQQVRGRGLRPMRHAGRFAATLSGRRLRGT